MKWSWTQYLQSHKNFYVINMIVIVSLETKALKSLQAYYFTYFQIDPSHSRLHSQEQVINCTYSWFLEECLLHEIEANQSSELNVSRIWWRCLDGILGGTKTDQLSSVKRDIPVCCFPYGFSPGRPNTINLLNYVQGLFSFTRFNSEKI